MRFHNDILVPIDKRHCVMLLFLDLSAPFDSVDHDILLTRLHSNYSISGIALEWLRSYLTNRSQFALIEGCRSQSRELKCGVPQGSVLGPVSEGIKSVSMRKPGRTRQGVIMLKSPISLKLGTNVRYQELAYVTECQVIILNSLGDPGSPCKNRHFARLCIIN